MPSSACKKKSKVPTSDQAHDLSGVWFDDHPRLIRVLDRYWAYTFTPVAPPMTPWAQAKFNAAKSSFWPHAVPIVETTDPLYHTCAPFVFQFYGVHRDLHSFPTRRSSDLVPGRLHEI